MNYIFSVIMNIEHSYDNKEGRTVLKQTVKQSCDEGDESYMSPRIDLISLPFKKHAQIDALNKETGETIEFKSANKFHRWKEEIMTDEIFTHVIRYFSTNIIDGVENLHDTQFFWEELEVDDDVKYTAFTFPVMFAKADGTVFDDACFDDFEEMKDFIFEKAADGFFADGNRVFVNRIDATAYFKNEPNCTLTVEGDDHKVTVVFTRDIAGRIQ